MQISRTSESWLALVAFVETRMAAYAKEAMTPSCPSDRRLELVHRHDELAMVLQAPALIAQAANGPEQKHTRNDGGY